MSYNVAILDASERHLGITEWPGARHNPEILKMFADAGHAWVQDDETAWCAAYMASLLGEVGLTGTGKLNARSYLDWGEPVDARDARPGDVVILWRNSPNSWQGHVAILVRFEGSHMILRGGNQGNAVSDKPYSMSRLLGFRRADGGRSESKRPVLKVGSRGRLVMDLQTALRDLGYHLGAVDGHFGRITERAVMSFQSANSLVTDGIVGRRTWGALENADPAPAPVREHVSTKSLREAGSREIRAADSVQTASALQVAGGAGSLGAIGTLSAELRVAKDGLEEVGATVGAEGPIGEMLPYIAGLIVLALAGLAVWQFVSARKAKQARLERAQSGADLSL